MRFTDYSYRHGRELIKLLHEDKFNDIVSILEKTSSFSHGETKGETVKGRITSKFKDAGWENEARIALGTEKNDKCDLRKGRIILEEEYSRYEIFFRDFFRFAILYDRKEIDAGVVITYDESLAFHKWKNKNFLYPHARASIQKLSDILESEYSRFVRVPIWCMSTDLGPMMSHSLVVGSM